MPVALCAGMIMAMVMIVIRGVMVMTMIIAVVMIASAVMMMVANSFGGSFDVDVRNAVSGMGMPQTVADTRHGPRIKHQTVPGIESAECSLPAKDLVVERPHIRLSNDWHPDV